MLVKLIKAVWGHWKERHERAQGKESGLDVLQPARTQLIPAAFVSGVSHSSHQPGLGPAQPLLGAGLGPRVPSNPEMVSLTGAAVNQGGDLGTSVWDRSW